MSLLQERPRQPLNNERGNVLIEIGLYAALITVGAVAVLALIGPKIVTAFEAINTAL